MVGIMVTEPDYGSDVAGVKVAATPTDGGWLVSGVKTWATFAGRADVLMLLARTDPDKSKSHRGLSVMIVEKPRAEGHSFAFDDGRGGKMEGRAIDTIGYRGMHSYEVAFDNWFVPAENLIGGEAGLGRGFYFQMAGFENGRLQTAARAVGLMQAAFEAGMSYAQDRKVFGSPVFDYQLSKVKLARMATLIQAGRQFSYDVARKMAAGEGTLEASMVKAYVCRAAEWVTREAMQLHGGMGYAEEFPVSRFFVDARVLSIFEGADETCVCASSPAASPKTPSPRAEPCCSRRRFGAGVAGVVGGDECSAAGAFDEGPAVVGLEVVVVAAQTGRDCPAQCVLISAQGVLWSISTDRAGALDVRTLRTRPQQRDLLRRGRSPSQVHDVRDSRRLS